ncbi:MAG: hypothetical protein ABSE53_05615 [Terracidiphilus sp.]
MRFDLYFANAERGGGYKYLCRIHPKRDAAMLHLSGETKFDSEDEMRLRLKGILLSTSIERAINVLQAHEMQQVEYRNIELSDEQARRLGWPKTAPVM